MTRPSWAATALAAAFAAGFAFPAFWMLATALRPPEELWSLPPWLPTRLDPASFSTVLGTGGFLRSIANSVALASLGAVLTVGLAAPAAYALARLVQKGQSAWLALLLALSLLPPVCLVGGLYGLYSDLGWINHLAALALPLAALQLPLAVWLLTPAFVRVPPELEEAAWMDGCSRAEAFFRVVLPAASAPLATAALLVSAFFWNEFLIGFSLSFDPQARPVTVTVALFQGAYHQPWGELCAAAALAALPLVLMVLAFQGRLVEGLSAGSGREG